MYYCCNMHFNFINNDFSLNAALKMKKAPLRSFQGCKFVVLATGRCKGLTTLDDTNSLYLYEERLDG